MNGNGGRMNPPAFIMEEEEGSAMNSQHENTVVLVDWNDRVIGSATLQEARTATIQHPYGLLHRMASLFVFDKETNRLCIISTGSSESRDYSGLSSNNLWTSSLTAYPYHGKTPNEVVEDGNSSTGGVGGGTAGIQNAIVRTLVENKKSLLLPPPQFITRLHSKSNMNYVYFATVENQSEWMTTMTSASNSESNTANQKWVTKDELQNLVDDPSTPVSQTLKLALQHVLQDFWMRRSSPQKSFPSMIHCDDTIITTAASDNSVGVIGDESKKQGAYGKIKVHKESKLQQLLRVTEVWSALKFLYITPLSSNVELANPDMEFCDEILVAVSRSFAAVIRQLPKAILDDVAIFYLVLRALDTVEDDTTAFASHDEKIRHLLSFHINALENPHWTMDGVGQGDERRLLQEFHKCHAVYATLPPTSRAIISDITQRMAAGMAEFVDKDLGQGTKDIKEYNRYCHFVAGLVGEGLSRLFANCKLENPSLAKELFLSDQMGLFLQKTNIIRDFLEDYVDKRAFWPQSVWKKYSPTGELGYFCNQDDPVVRTKSLHCLNELVADALELVPDCLAYMSKLQCMEVFRFCAIPQVMAIATLEKCYNNLDVFTGVVKIRKGLSCKLILRTNNLSELHETFYEFANKILKTCHDERRKKGERGGVVVDPNYARTVKACETVLDLTRSKAKVQQRARAVRGWSFVALVFVAVFWQSVSAVFSNFLLLDDSSTIDLSVVRAGVIVALSILYWLFGPLTVRSNLKTADLLKGRTVV